jgi:hypothetical protein
MVFHSPGDSIDRPSIVEVALQAVPPRQTPCTLCAGRVVCVKSLETWALQVQLDEQLVALLLAQNFFVKKIFLLRL